MRNLAKANLLALIESTNDLIWSVDLDYRLIAFNRALQENFQKKYGVTLAAGMNATEFMPPERAELWAPLYLRALKEGSFRADYPLADGRTLELSFNPIVAAGKITGVSVFGKDITERKRAEEKYQAIFDGALEGFYHFTPEGRAVTVNRAFAKMLGYESSQEAIASITDAALDIRVEPEERALVVRRIEEQNYIRNYECRFKRKNGSILWVLLNCRGVRGNNGRLIRLEGSIQEITDRKRAEQALRESESRFRTFFEQGSSVTLLIDPANAEIVDANPAAAKFYGYTHEQLVGMSISRINPLTEEQSALVRQRVVSEESSHFNFRHRLASGEIGRSRSMCRRW